MASNIVRTRFAPSPTGYMHVGNLRTALYAFLKAKSAGGTFILRIEDTDQERYVEGAVDIIYNTLRETGLIWDEGPDIGGPVGPYVQSERMGMFKGYAEQLVKEGKAYYCFCDKERLDEMRLVQKASGQAPHYDGHCRSLSPQEVQAKLDAGLPYVIRQKMPKTGTTSFEDVVYGHIEVDNATLDDQILIKTDGMPTYNFANVVDDHLMGITHVIRGSEYLSSTPKYNLLYKDFGWDIPTYIHCPPVMKDAQNKLSKRNGDASYQDLVAKGYLKEAVLNYILLLGWSPKGEREIDLFRRLLFCLRQRRHRGGRNFECGRQRQPRGRHYLRPRQRYPRGGLQQNRERPCRRRRPCQGRCRAGKCQTSFLQNALRRYRPVRKLPKPRPHLLHIRAAPLPARAGPHQGHPRGPGAGLLNPNLNGKKSACFSARALSCFQSVTCPAVCATPKPTEMAGGCPAGVSRSLPPLAAKAGREVCDRSP